MRCVPPRQEPGHRRWVGLAPGGIHRGQLGGELRVRVRVRHAPPAAALAARVGDEGVLLLRRHAAAGGARDRGQGGRHEGEIRPARRRRGVGGCGGGRKIRSPVGSAWVVISLLDLVVGLVASGQVSGIRVGGWKLIFAPMHGVRGKEGHLGVRFRLVMIQQRFLGRNGARRCRVTLHGWQVIISCSCIKFRLLFPRRGCGI